MKFDWKKLLSRKFFALIASVAVCSCVIFGADTVTSERIAALIMAIGSVITYMFANVSQKKSEASRKNNDIDINNFKG